MWPPRIHALVEATKYTPKGEWGCKVRNRRETFCMKREVHAGIPKQGSVDHCGEAC